MPKPRIITWLRLVTNDLQVSLEIRLFRMICLVLAVALLGLVLPTNLVTGLPWLFHLVILGLGLAMVFFLVASLRGHQFIRLAHFLSIVILNESWFMNAGSRGSIPFFFFPLVVYSLILFRGRDRWLAIALLAVDFSALVVIETLWPALVIPFTHAEDRPIDLVSGFIAALVIVVGMLLVVVRGYQYQLSALRQAEDAKQLLNNKMRAILDNLPMMAWLKDTDSRLELVNVAFATIAERPMAECLGKTDWDLMPNDRSLSHMADDRRVCQAGERREFEETTDSPDGPRTSLTTKTPVRDTQGRVVGTAGMALDITDRRLADERLRASLAEKEILIAELYHRTKNNMQVISGIMAIQMVHVQDPYLQRVFRNMDLRIQSMSIVQRHLIEARDLSNINLRDYLVEQSGMLLQSHAVTGDRIHFDLSAVEDLRLLLDIAIPFGMVCNELLNNSLQHGYPGDQSGRIMLSLRQQDEHRAVAVMADDGVGVPEGFDFMAGHGVGLKLARAIAEQQLEGSLEIDGSAGVRCTLVFRTSGYSPRV